MRRCFEAKKGCELRLEASAHILSIIPENSYTRCVKYEDEL